MPPQSIRQKESHRFPAVSHDRSTVTHLAKQKRFSGDSCQRGPRKATHGKRWSLGSVQSERGLSHRSTIGFVIPCPLLSEICPLITLRRGVKTAI